MPVNRRVVRGALTVLWVAVFVAAAAVFLPQWDAVAAAAGKLRPDWLAAGVIALSACYGVLAGAWWLIVRVLGAPLAGRDAFRAFALSQLPKYLPGRVAGHGVRVTVATRAGVPTGVALTSIAIEGAFSLGSALAVTLAGVALEASPVTAGMRRWAGSALLVIAVMVAGLVVARRFAGRWHEWTGLVHLRGRPARIAGIALIYVALWLLMGLANWLIANSVTPIPLRLLPPFVVSVAAATGLGFVAVFAPGGLGVREGALFLLVRTWMSDPHAAVFVALSRLASFAIESALTAAGAAYPPRRGSDIVVAPSPLDS